MDLNIISYGVCRGGGCGSMGSIPSAFVATLLIAELAILHLALGLGGGDGRCRVVLSSRWWSVRRHGGAGGPAVGLAGAA
jgi:hypothetical protein